MEGHINLPTSDTGICQIDDILKQARTYISSVVEMQHCQKCFNLPVYKQRRIT